MDLPCRQPHQISRGRFIPAFGTMPLLRLCTAQIHAKCRSFGLNWCLLGAEGQSLSPKPSFASAVLIKYDIKLKRYVPKITNEITIQTTFNGAS